MQTNRPLKLLGFIFVSIIANTSCAESEKIDLKKDQFIFDAREVLINGGWNPLETFEKTGTLLDKETGSAGSILKAGAIEVGFCSGTGINYCQFNYQKSEQCLQVLTGGEYFKEDKSPKVISWEIIDCESLVTQKKAEPPPLLRK
jgi:hypothetical protein